MKMMDGTRPVARLVLGAFIGALVTAGCLAAPLATSSVVMAAGKKDPGEKLYLRRTCMACHGKGGVKAIQDYPNIAGQDKKYMLDQIGDILAGKRTGSPDFTGHPRAEGMRGALVTADGKIRVTDDEIKQIVNWLADQPPAPPAPLVSPLTETQMKAGADAYKKGKCQTCHGKDGTKPLKGYPYIAGQKQAYIIAQVKDIRDKLRTNGKTKVMLPFVRKLSDEQITVIATYLSQIDRTAK